MPALWVIFVCLFTWGAKILASTPGPSIIIVGTGPSGIAAATRLLKHNFTNMKILEAENRIGGRIHSIHFGEAYVDMGAQFCHGETDNIVYSLVKDLGVLRHSSSEDHFFHSSGEIISDKLGEKLLHFAESLEAGEGSIDACENATSVGECLRLKFKNFLNSVQDAKEGQILNDSYYWIDSHLSALDSPFDLDDLEITSAYKKCEGDLGLNWNGLGYKTVLDVMMQKYPKIDNQLPIDEKIFLRTEVTNISNWHEDKLTVNTLNGMAYEGDHVIFTPSVGVLKSHYESLFNPSLPHEKAEAIRHMGYGAIVKVHMHFPFKWWNDDAVWSLIWSAHDQKGLKEENLEWLLDIGEVTKSANNPKVLTAWYAGSHVPAIEQLSEEQLLDGQIYVLKKFFEPHFNVTQPDKIVRFQNFSNSALGQYDNRILADTFQWLNNILCALDSPFDLNDLKPHSAYKICEGNLRLNWNGLGYKTVLEVLMQKYPNTGNVLSIEDKISFDLEVTNVANWLNGDKLRVNTSSGALYEADHVILTPSVGVLKATYRQLFDPLLPSEKVAAIENIGFGAIVKIQLRFPQRWWNEDAKWYFIWSDKDKKKLRERNLEWLANIAKLLQGENNPKVLTAWYAGSSMPLIESLSESQVLEGHNYLLNTFFGAQFNVTLPNKILRSTWYSNPHFRGAYSYESVKGHLAGRGPYPEVLGSPLRNNKNKPTVLFAGEATHPYYFSTVHGAIESGFREADRLINFYIEN